LIVQPFFWQACWFRVAVLLVIALGLLGWARQVRRLHARIRQLEAAAGFKK
jgi:hypothetical protein